MNIAKLPSSRRPSARALQPGVSTPRAFASETLSLGNGLPTDPLRSFRQTLQQQKAAALKQIQQEEQDNPDPHQVEKRVVKIVQEQFNVPEEEIRPETSYQQDLGADSLDVVDLLMSFQEEFAIEIPEEDAQQLDTVGKTVSYIQQRLNKPDNQSGPPV